MIRLLRRRVASLPVPPGFMSGEFLCGWSASIVPTLIWTQRSSRFGSSREAAISKFGCDGWVNFLNHGNVSFSIPDASGSCTRAEAGFNSISARRAWAACPIKGFW